MVKRLLLRAPEVRELQTGMVTLRRKVKAQPALMQSGGTITQTGHVFLVENWPKQERSFSNFGRCETIKCPLGAPGERRWVAEKLQVIDSDQGENPEFLGQFIMYWCDGECRGWTHDEELGVELYPFKGKYVPSSRMPQWASRMTAETVSVRVEQVDGIWWWVVEVKRV